MNVKNYIEDELVIKSNIEPLQSVKGKELKLTDKSIHTIMDIVTDVEETHGAISLGYDVDVIDWKETKSLIS